ncbi:hypothetical protein [Anaerosporobacter sp.]
MDLMNCIAAELVVICMISAFLGGKISWYRRYHGVVQQVMLFIAGGLVAYANADNEDETFMYIGGVLMIVSLLLCILGIKRLLTTEKPRCISLKAGEYRIELTEQFIPSGGANMLLGHRIITNNEVIQCVSNTPEENADLDVYVSEDRQGNLRCEYFAYKRRDWSASRIIFGVTALLICICGLLLPIITLNEITANGIDAERTDLFTNIIVLIFGGTGVLLLKNAKKDLLYRILYYFSWGAYVIGILGVLVSFI